jgi:hypothetical protein
MLLPSWAQTSCQSRPLGAYRDGGASTSSVCAPPTRRLRDIKTPSLQAHAAADACAYLARRMAVDQRPFTPKTPPPPPARHRNPNPPAPAAPSSPSPSFHIFSEVLFAIAVVVPIGMLAIVDQHLTSFRVTHTGGWRAGLVTAAGRLVAVTAAGRRATGLSYSKKQQAAAAEEEDRSRSRSRLPVHARLHSSPAPDHTNSPAGAEMGPIYQNKTIQIE